MIERGERLETGETARVLYFAQSDENRRRALIAGAREAGVDFVESERPPLRAVSLISTDADPTQLILSGRLILAQLGPIPREIVDTRPL